MPMIDQPVAVVTGASRGIGNAIAEALVGDGYAIVAVGSSSAEAVSANMERIARHARPWTYLQADVSAPAGREAVLSGAMERFGRVDVLVNNAGVAPKTRMDLLETTEESLDYVLGVNLKSAFFLSQGAARLMVRLRPEISGFSPKIINISSISAYTSSTMRGEYCISKAAVSMVTQLFADRLAGEGINVYEIRPGIIATDMTAPVRGKYDELIVGGITPIRRWGETRDVANAARAICSGLLDFSTGEVINVDGGFHIRRL